MSRRRVLSGREMDANAAKLAKEAGQGRPA